jgi:hypothetical protein
MALGKVWGLGLGLGRIQMEVGWEVSGVGWCFGGGGGRWRRQGGASVGASPAHSFPPGPPSARPPHLAALQHHGYEGLYLQDLRRLLHDQVVVPLGG